MTRDRSAQKSAQNQHKITASSPATARRLVVVELKQTQIGALIDPNRPQIDQRSILQNTDGIQTVYRRSGSLERTDQNRSEQIRTDQNRSEQIRSEQIRTEQIRSEQIRTDQNRSDQIRSEQIRSDQIRSDQIRSEQIRTDQNRSEQVRSDQNRSDQNRWHTVAWFPRGQ